MRKNRFLPPGGVAQDPIPGPTLAQQKWGDALKSGFQVVPNILIQAHKTLQLDPLDVLIVLNLNMHWWEPSSLPYPRPTLIADRIGVTRRTIERRLYKLQKLGLIERLPAESLGGKRSIKRFRLDGLVRRLALLAENAISVRMRIGEVDLDSG